MEAATFAPDRIDEAVLGRAAHVIRVLGHPLRLRILELIETEERPVKDLVAETGASQAIVSQQLAILRGAGVVGARRDGLHVYYRITEPKVFHILACIRECELPESIASQETALTLVHGALAVRPVHQTRADRDG
jgi:ArsR family transcriptional regulator